jgi:hypothetical protein
VLLAENELQGGVKTVEIGTVREPARMTRPERAELGVYGCDSLPVKEVPGSTAEPN